MKFMPDWLSQGVEVLLAQLEATPESERSRLYDVIVVGSGYGGAVAAARLARLARLTQDGQTREPLRVCVLERGREYVPGSFPSSMADLPGHVRLSRFDDAQPQGMREGLFDMRVGEDVSVLLANGLGGGSLINAAVAERAAADVFADPAWPGKLQKPGALDDWYSRAEAMLGVAPADVGPDAALGVGPLEKYRALIDAARAMGAATQPAKVAIRMAGAAPLAEGAPAQQPCIRCGDCVTGCNHWAKNTLAMNYLPAAVRHGARLFTGASVERVERRYGGWDVWFQPQVAKRSPDYGSERVLSARHVILAAGSFGSTEILLRSRARGLALSAQLGRRFSANGDTIGALADDAALVNAAAPEYAAYAKRNIGPTISGIARAGATRSERVVVEELAIPGALWRVFGEIIATGSLAAKLSSADDTPHGAETVDPAAVDPGVLKHTQIFAAMGDDGARGRLDLVEGWRDSEAAEGALRVVWPKAGSEPIFGVQDRLLRQAEWAGGTYLSNPFWKPLPDDIAKQLSGPQPTGQVFSVHPLGGCPMGDDVNSGVVDHLGRVFDAGTEPGRLHPGLLVLDGSIVPTALGINPLLTITALAERAIDGYAAECKWTSSAHAAQPLSQPPAFPKPSPPAEPFTTIRFSEVMSGPLELAGLPGLPESRLEVVFGAIRDIPKFLASAAHSVTLESGSLRLDDGAAAKVSGTVGWMVRAESAATERKWRAFLAYLRERGIADFFATWREQGIRAAFAYFAPGGKGGLLQKLLAFFSRWREAGLLEAIAGVFDIFKLASQVGEVRELRYTLRLEEPLMNKDTPVLPVGTQLHGVKTLRYARGANPLTQLSELAVQVERPGEAPVPAGKLTIDPLELFRRFAVQMQVIEQRDKPSALLDLAAIGMFMARIVLKVHFWTFRAPEYEKYDPARFARRVPGELSGLRMERYEVASPVKESGASLTLQLTRYRSRWLDEMPAGQPVLLFHGFGASGGQYATPRLRRNLVRHLAEAGHDVWVAELRTSIALASSRRQWTLDEVALHDVPALVDAVLERTRRSELDVVAHCIGSAMFCTAVLAGRLRDASASGSRSKVRRAVLLQVGPLITLSPGNRLRGYLAAFLRRYAQVDFVDSTVDDSASWFNALIDRALAALPYPERERVHHRLGLWGNAHIANCNRSAAVFGRLFEHDNFSRKMLDSLGELLGHTNLTTFEQTVHYAFEERLTDRDGSNSYVTDSNVKDNFDFPVRFLHGSLNDVFAPKTTQRSLDLLLRVHGKDCGSDRVELDGYGHLDPLVGRNAWRDVYPHIAKFIAPQPQGAALAPLARPGPPETRPALGPVLGWVRRVGGLGGGDTKHSAWVARLWCRVDDRIRFPDQAIVRVANRSGIVRARVAKVQPVGLDRLAAFDVVLGSKGQDYEIVVSGGFEPGKNPSQSAHHKFTWSTRPAPGSVGRGLPPPGPEPNAEARSCDPGYDQRIGSARIDEALLARLECRGRITFALASCRYPASMIDREQADRGFREIHRLLESGHEELAPSLLVLAGDQIYADATAGLFDPKTRRERFNASYAEAWGAPAARALLRRLPTYMMPDDHEIEDDWDPRGPRTDMTRWGMAAAAHFQTMHSPANAERLARAAGLDRSQIQPPAQYYAFEASGFPFFVCDTRFGRSTDRIVAVDQMKALTTWLGKHEAANKARPKFVVSPSVVAPFLRVAQQRAEYATRSDGWDGFPASLSALLDFIAEKNIQNVVFLCGDAHFSMASELEYPGANPALRSYCIVSSALYAPFPFANAAPHDFFDTGSMVFGTGRSVQYRVVSDFPVLDNLLTIRAWSAANNWHVCAQMHPVHGAPAQAIKLF